MRADNVLVIDATVYEDKTSNVYEVFDMWRLKTEQDLLNHQYGKGVWKRFELDFKTNKVVSYDLARPKHGNYELPTYNELYEGVKENCITYLLALFENQILDDNYGFDIRKFDSCKKEFVDSWSTPGYLPAEPYFIANPDGKSEDDGVIMTLTYDF